MKNDKNLSTLSGSWQALDRRMRVNGRRLFIGGERSVRRTLRIRALRPEEIGRLPVEMGESLILRVVRGAQAFSFWEPEARIRAGDKLVVISPAGAV